MCFDSHATLFTHITTTVTCRIVLRSTSADSTEYRTECTALPPTVRLTIIVLLLIWMECNITEKSFKTDSNGFLTDTKLTCCHFIKDVVLSSYATYQTNLTDFLTALLFVPDQQLHAYEHTIQQYHVRSRSYDAAIPPQNTSIAVV